MDLLIQGSPCSSIKEKLPSSVKVRIYLDKILARVRKHEVKRICIIEGALRCPGTPFGIVRGQGAAERIHKIDPTVQVLVVNGREYATDPRLPQGIQVGSRKHKPNPIKNANELYVDAWSGTASRKLPTIVRQFFDGTLKVKGLRAKDLSVSYM